MRLTSETTSNGVSERLFTLADIPGVLWSPADAAGSRPLVLLRSVAFGPDGRYKFDGDVTGQFWHVIGMRRFEPGELDPYLTEVRRLAQEAPF
jgi:hypothetical protein